MQTINIEAPEDMMPDGVEPKDQTVIIRPKRLNFTGYFAREIEIPAEDVKPLTTFSKEEKMRPGEYLVYVEDEDEPIDEVRLTPQQRMKIGNLEITIPWEYLTEREGALH